MLAQFADQHQLGAHEEALDTAAYHVRLLAGAGDDPIAKFLDEDALDWSVSDAVRDLASMLPIRGVDYDEDHAAIRNFMLIQVARLVDGRITPEEYEHSAIEVESRRFTAADIPTLPADELPAAKEIIAVAIKQRGLKNMSELVLAVFDERRAAEGDEP